MPSLHTANAVNGPCGVAMASQGEYSMASTDSEYFIVSGSRMADVISPTQQAAPQGTTRVLDYEWVHDDIRRHASGCTSATSIDDLRL